MSEIPTHHLTRFLSSENTYLGINFVQFNCQGLFGMLSKVD